MWPKALSQLIELAPHITRLVPMADRFLNAKSADAEASRNAMQQMAEGLRGDLGQVTASHSGLYRQLNDQSEKLSTLAADVRTTKMAIGTVDERLARLESQNKVLLTLAYVLIAAAVIVIALLAIPHFSHH